MSKCYCPNPKVNGYNSAGKALITHQDLSLHNPELYEEVYDPSKHRRLIKDWCVYCRIQLPKTWDYYWRSGNCCGKCSVKQELRIRKG